LSHLGLHPFPTRRSSDLRSSRASTGVSIASSQRTAGTEQVGARVRAGTTLPSEDRGDGGFSRWLRRSLARPGALRPERATDRRRSEEHTSELQYLGISYA